MRAALFIGAVSLCIGESTARPARAAFALPAWLQLQPGTRARIAQAPWPVRGSEAALTGSEDTAKTDPTESDARPSDVVHEPAGIEITIEDVYDDRVALVRPVGEVWDAYTRIESLIPDVPRGTGLVVSGGFGRFAYFYPQLATPTARADQLPDGTPLVALAEATAPPDLGSDDLVRLKVLVAGGAFHGRVGWIAVNYTGLPLGAAAPSSSAERDCACRQLEFR